MKLQVGRRIATPRTHTPRWVGTKVGAFKKQSLPSRMLLTRRPPRHYRKPIHTPVRYTAGFKPRTGIIRSMPQTRPQHTRKRRRLERAALWTGTHIHSLVRSMPQTRPQHTRKRRRLERATIWAGSHIHSLVKRMPQTKPQKTRVRRRLERASLWRGTHQHSFVIGRRTQRRKARWSRPRLKLRNLGSKTPAAPKSLVRRAPAGRPRPHRSRARRLRTFVGSRAATTPRSLLPRRRGRIRRLYRRIQRRVRWLPTIPIASPDFCPPVYWVPDSTGENGFDADASGNYVEVDDMGATFFDLDPSYTNWQPDPGMALADTDAPGSRSTEDC